MSAKDQPIDEKIEAAIRDGLGNHTGEWFNRFIAPGISLSQEDSVDLLMYLTKANRLKQNIKELIQAECNKARINSLLDLEQWAKLHNLGSEMILDGIEHMVISTMQVPDQPRLKHDARIAELLKGEK